MEFDFIKAGLLFLLLLRYHHISWEGGGEGEGEGDRGEKNIEDFKPDQEETQSDSLSR